MRAARSRRLTPFSIPGRHRPLKRGSDLSKHDVPDLRAETPQDPIRAVGAKFVIVGWARAIRATDSANHPENGYV